VRYKREKDEIAEGDMTPMIDMTFQLIAFFMVLINFTEAEQDDRITLPQSELAKPPEEAPPAMLTLQITKEGQVILSGQLYPFENLRGILDREADIISRRHVSATAALIIIRADQAAKTGEVQAVIRVCQEAGFEQFALRAEQRAAPDFP